MKHAAWIAVPSRRDRRRLFRGLDIEARSGVHVPFALDRNGSGSAERLIPARRQPLQPLGLDQQYAAKAALDLPLGDHLR